MNFVPQDDPHKLAIQQLSAQIDEYLATGKRIESVPAGATVNPSMFGQVRGTKNKKASTSNASNE